MHIAATVDVYEWDSCGGISDILCQLQYISYTWTIMVVPSWQFLTSGICCHI